MRHRFGIVVVALVLAASACESGQTGGGLPTSPTGPSVTPPVPTEPAVTFITTMKVVPDNGMTVDYSGHIFVTVKYNLVGTYAGPVSLITYLSVDGVNIILGSGFGTGITTASGTVRNIPHNEADYQIKETHYIINRLATVERYGIPVQTLVEEVVPWNIKFP